MSVPLHRAGMSKMRSFFYGQLSGMVEPIAGLIGALAVNSMQAILPYALGFAAGGLLLLLLSPDWVLGRFRKYIFRYSWLPLDI